MHVMLFRTLKIKISAMNRDAGVAITAFPTTLTISQQGMFNVYYFNHYSTLLCFLFIAHCHFCRRHGSPSVPCKRLQLSYPSPLNLSPSVSPLMNNSPLHHSFSRKSSSTSSLHHNKHLSPFHGQKDPHSCQKQVQSIPDPIHMVTSGSIGSEHSLCGTRFIPGHTPNSARQVISSPLAKLSMSSSLEDRWGEDTADVIINFGQTLISSVCKTNCLQLLVVYMISSS